MFYILLLRFTLRLSLKKQLLPTVDLLKTFLLVLEKKIGCSGIVGDLEGWRMILIAPETGLQPLFGIPDPLDNSNHATPMEVNSGGHKANTSPDGEQFVCNFYWILTWRLRL